MQNVDFFRLYENFTFEVQKALFTIQNIKNRFLSGFFCSKKLFKKKVAFWQKPCTNPFAKCRFFSTLLQLHLSGLKSIRYYPEYQKMFLSGSFALKQHIRKRSIFWQKPWTNPFAKCRFFWLWKNFTFQV